METAIAIYLCEHVLLDFFSVGWENEIENV
jgi:hypothetical protein